MELFEVVAAVLRREPGAADALEKQPRAAWTRDAAKLATVLAPYVPPAGSDARSALRLVLRSAGAADFVRLLLEPGSAHGDLALELAIFVGPSDELESRLRELPVTDATKRALAVAAGEGLVDDLARSMGKPFTSAEVRLAIDLAIDDVKQLGPKQLARSAPRLVELLRNWRAVTGGDDASQALYRVLQRADLPELIKAFEAHFVPMNEAQRSRTLGVIRDLYFDWPSGAQWAENVIEYFEPSEDEPLDDDDGPPAEVSAFRRR